jgi:hypothetical protein
MIYMETKEVAGYKRMQGTGIRRHKWGIIK